MRYILIFAALLLFGQTKIDLSKQAINSPISPNWYFTTITIGNKTQLLPGPFFGSTAYNASIPPANSNAKCAQPYDGNSHPTYEFALIGMQIFNDNYVYICAPDKRWRRFRVEEF